MCEVEGEREQRQGGREREKSILEERTQPRIHLHEHVYAKKI